MGFGAWNGFGRFFRVISPELLLVLIRFALAKLFVQFLPILLLIEQFEEEYRKKLNEKLCKSNSD